MQTKCLLDNMKFDELCRLKYDCADSGDYWICRDGEDLYIAHQVVGSPAKAILKIPVNNLRVLVKALTKQQEVKWDR